MRNVSQFVRLCIWGAGSVALLLGCQRSQDANRSSMSSAKSEPIQPAVYGTIKKPKERPANADSICRAWCAHSTELGCGASERDCHDGCSSTLSAPKCGQELRELYTCQSQLAQRALECKDGELTLKDATHCRSEERALQDCRQDAPRQ